jgi:hypothetical protein
MMALIKAQFLELRQAVIIRSRELGNEYNGALQIRFHSTSAHSNKARVGNMSFTAYVRVYLV